MSQNTPLRLCFSLLAFLRQIIMALTVVMTMTTPKIPNIMPSNSKKLQAYIYNKHVSNSSNSHIILISYELWLHKFFGKIAHPILYIATQPAPQTSHLSN